MRRLLVGVMMAVAAGGSGWAAEVVPGPLCARPAVLQRVMEELQRAGQTGVIEAGSVGQTPGTRTNGVTCALRVRTVFYDTARFGSVPQEAVRVVQYSLDLRRNGVFVRLRAQFDRS